MSYQRGDKVIVYGDDLLQPQRRATVVSYNGRDSKRFPTYLVELENGYCSVVRDVWLERQAAPMLDINAKDYLDILNELSNYQ